MRMSKPGPRGPVHPPMPELRRAPRESIAAVPLVQAPSPIALDATSSRHQARNRAQATISCAPTRLSPDGTPGGEARRPQQALGTMPAPDVRSGRDERAAAKTVTPQAARTSPSRQVQAACRPPRRRLLRPADSFAHNVSRELRQELRNPRRPPGARRRARATPRRAPVPT